MFWRKKKVDPSKCHHDYGKWMYQTDDSCRQIQACQVCSQQNSSTHTKHVWGEWVYLQDEPDGTADSCLQQRYCQRCGTVYKRRPRVQHNWEEWQADGGSCRQKRVCQRCQQVETTTTHQWGPWTAVAPDSCEQKQTCQKCGDVFRKGSNFLPCPHCGNRCLERKSKWVKSRVVGSSRSSVDWEDLHQSRHEIWYVCAHCDTTYTEAEFNKHS